jgi:hypothetical protein
MFGVFNSIQFNSIQFYSHSIDLLQIDELVNIKQEQVNVYIVCMAFVRIQVTSLSLKIIKKHVNYFCSEYSSHEFPSEMGISLCIWSQTWLMKICTAQGVSKFAIVYIIVCKSHVLATISVRCSSVTFRRINQQTIQKNRLEEMEKWPISSVFPQIFLVHLPHGDMY